MPKNDSKTLEQKAMKRYLKNLWGALCGSDPFRAELDEARERLEKAADNMAALQDQYYSALEKWHLSMNAQKDSDATNEKLLKRLADCEKRAAGFQTLIENLRQRIREKDAEMENAGREFRERMEQMKQDYQQRIGEYNQKIDELTNKG